MSSRSAAITPPPARRLALLEARLNPPAPLTDEDEVRSFSSDVSTPRPTFNPRRRYAPRARSRDSAANIAKKRKRGSPASMRNTRVDSFFKPAAGKRDEEFLRSSPPPDSDGEDVPGTPPVPADGYRHFRERVDKLSAENDTLKGMQELADELRAENEDLRTQIELEVPDLKAQLAAKAEEARGHSARADALARALRDSIVKVARAERREARSRVTSESERLGKVVVERTRTSLHEVWEDGDQWKEVHARLERIQTEREAVERKRKEMAKRKAASQKGHSSDKTNEDCAGADAKKKGEMPPPPTPASKAAVPFEETVEYAIEQEEIYRVQSQLLKREESSLQDQRTQLARERDIMVREIRRQSDERSSSFTNFPLLNERYVLLNLLGRGGFSEVFKAFDLQRAVPVACKIHQLASNWSEEKKRSFIRHAWREYQIHKTLKHPRVVQLVDIFDIDDNSFCTVLEYCEGSDLDSYLRANKTLAEKEARSIISQVFSGLQYLASQKQRIIHYDLKPGNILLHDGEVQITDFGLSKVMSEAESTTEGMELTSQGAGTMWYLPPECFETVSQARISVKVDVWSAGVVLFQMLYGRKPFGHDQSQEKMYREKTVSHQELEFPARPAVSDLAKDFMKKCLTRKPAGRPDVRQALLHPFLQKR